MKVVPRSTTSAFGVVHTLLALILWTVPAVSQTQPDTVPGSHAGMGDHMDHEMDHEMDHDMSPEMGHDMGHAHGGTDPAGWRMPPMDMTMPMPPSLMALEPDVSPYLPGIGMDPNSIPAAVFRRIENLSDGDTLDLEAGLVRRTVAGRELVMYGFNGQYPGPLIRASEGETIIVNFTNNTDLPTAVHWHGVRLDNRFDGVPHVTQDPILPGESFIYEVYFRDAGIYWYHPHHREDIMQDLGLYGNMQIASSDPDYYNLVDHEEVLILDDLLIDDLGLFPYGKESTTHALMGRFGNIMLTNGEPAYSLDVEAGEVVRFFFTNVANTRIFNLSFGGVPIKLIGSDVGKFEREQMVETLVIAPAERYIVEVEFEEAGRYALTNNIQAIDHYRGVFKQHVDTLGAVSVREGSGSGRRADFDQLREHPEVIADIDEYRHLFDRPVDHELSFSVKLGEVPLPILRMIEVDTFYFTPVEWNEGMPEMNYPTTGQNVTWILRDEMSGKENLDIDWRFKVGDVVKLRLSNLPGDQTHPMQHPIHVHGQRFLVLTQDGIPTQNMVWKDTAVVPFGSVVEILVEMSNPGDWMIHCHIAEHLEAGMQMIFKVET